jgi:hypothetical protein
MVTPWLYLSFFVLTVLCIPLLLHLKKKDAQLFIQGFLSYTVLQMLFIIIGMLVVIKFHPNLAKNFAAQLLFVSFFVLIFQSILLAKTSIQNH